MQVWEKYIILQTEALMQMPRLIESGIGRRRSIPASIEARSM